ncbi:MAG: hypothetical protein LUI12_07200 [Clostridiales bacterium]|nr:hypothetical protein [Clostridiales bacterium]
MNFQNRYEYWESNMDKKAAYYNYYQAKKKQALESASKNIEDMIYARALADLEQAVQAALLK